MVEVTPEALLEFQRKLEARGTPTSAVRLGVRGGGCSGYKFVISFDDVAPKETDHVLGNSAVKLIIDSKSAMILSGSTVVWRDTPTAKGFDIVNPNERSRCGCGRSFSVR